MVDTDPSPWTLFTNPMWFTGPILGGKNIQTMSPARPSVLGMIQCFFL